MRKFTPKLVVFDFDGTLVEFHRDFLFSEAFRLLPQLGITDVNHQVMATSFAEFDFFRFVAEAERERVIEGFWQGFDWASFPAPVAIPGTGQMLSQLTSGGVKVGLATARICQREDLERDLRQIGMLSHFSHLSSRSDESVHWTDKRSMLREICDRLEVDLAEAVMVGDIPADVISARDAGFGYTVAVLSGGIRRAVLEQAEPDMIIDDVSTLHEVLNLDVS